MFLEWHQLLCASFVLNIFDFAFKWLVIRFVISISAVQVGSDKWFINPQKRITWNIYR